MGVGRVSDSARQTTKMDNIITYRVPVSEVAN